MKFLFIRISFFRRNKFKLFFLFLFFVFTSCGKNKNFKGETLLSKLGYKEFVAKNWKFSNDKLQCLVSREVEEFELQTERLLEGEGNVEMRVRLGFFNLSTSGLNENWAGFSIRSKAEEAGGVSKDRISLGVCANGSLFIGTPSLNQRNNKIVKSLKEGVDLKVDIKYDNVNNYTITLSVLDSSNDEVLGAISKRNISSKQVEGKVVLVSGFHNKDSKMKQKSIWFQDWEMKGSKVVSIAK